MSGILEQAFGSRSVDLYSDVLCVSRDANNAQLRKAFYKQALKYHPDKNSSEEAKTKFQAISWSYDLLKDAGKRAEYDRTGHLPSEDCDFGDDDDMNSKPNAWKEYFDTIFGKLSTDDIDSFAMKYKMSDEEEKDVLENYNKFKGNFVMMLGFVMLSEERDVQRWVEDYIQPAIDAGTIQDFPDAIAKSRKKIQKKLDAARKKQAKEEAEEQMDDEEEEGSAAAAVAAETADDTMTESEDSDSGINRRDSKSKSKSANVKVKQPSAKNKNKTVKKAKPTKSKVKQSAASSSSSSSNSIAKKKSKTTTTKRKKAAPSSQADLIAAIRNKNRGGTNPLASLGARYGVAMDDDDPLDDAAFAKIQSRLGKKKRK